MGISVIGPQLDISVFIPFLKIGFTKDIFKRSGRIPYQALSAIPSYLTEALLFGAMIILSTSRTLIIDGILVGNEIRMVP